MQVFKNIVLFFLCLGLFGCNSSLTDNRIELSNQRYDIIDFDAINRGMATENTLNVGVLLPLTGKASDIGLGMQNAMFMALDDLQNNRMVLKFYDTKSSEEGAAVAADRALEDGVNLILGPLMSSEVSGVAPLALSADVPVVSFTTQKFLVFKGSSNWMKEYIKCCTTWFFSYLINAGLLEFIVKILHLNVFIAQIVATLAAAVFTYFLFKKFAFRVKKI